MVNVKDQSTGIMVEKRTYKYKNLKNGGMKILIAVAAVLLLAGDAGAGTCDSLANVRAWNGSISFTYSNSGSKSPLAGETVDWNLQQSADMSFRLEGASTNDFGSYSILVGSETGVANLNDMVKTTYTAGSPPTTETTTEIMQGNSLDTANVILSLDLTTCKYQFFFSPFVNPVHTYNNVPQVSSRTLVGVSNSGFYQIPITGLLSGSANFPVYKEITPSTDMEQYKPGGLGSNVINYASDMGSASVTWEFKPILTQGGIPTSTPTPINTPTSPTPTSPTQTSTATTPTTTPTSISGGVGVTRLNQTPITPTPTEKAPGFDIDLTAATVLAIYFLTRKQRKE